MVRRTRGLATLSTAIFAVGLVGCRVHEAKAVGEGAAVAARETTRGADGEADVGARATPRKQWATGQGADVGEPWTPPAPALAPGLPGAAERLSRGDAEAALAGLETPLDRLLTTTLPEREDPGYRAHVQARLLAGRALSSLGRHEEALLALEPLDATRGLKDVIPLDAFALELGEARIAAADAEFSDLQRRDELFGAAAAGLRRGLKLKTNRHRNPMRVLEAVALAGVEGRTPRDRKRASFRAVRALDKVIRDFDRHADRWWWALLRARALVRGERSFDARDAMREVVIEATGRPESAMAWVDLVSLVERSEAMSLSPWSPREQLRRAEAALRHRSLNTARVLVEEVQRREDLTRSMRADAEALEADIAYRAQDFDRCADIRRSRYEAASTPERRDALSRCLERAQRYEEAISLWEAVADDRKRNRHNRTAALWRATELAMRGARYDQAQMLLDRYEKRSTGHPSDRRLYRAWIDYRRGDLEQARAGFEKIERYDDERRDMARYYQAKTLLRSANPDAKRRGARELRVMARERAFDYYGLQARGLLEGAGEPVPPLPELRPLAAESDYVTYAQTLGALDEIVESFDDDIEPLNRARKLLAVGWIEEARREFRIAADGALNTYTRLAGGTVRSARTEAYAIGAGWEGGFRATSASLSSSARKIVRTKEDRARLWPLLQTVARGLDEPYRSIKLTSSTVGSREARWHPRAYRATVEREARDFGIDPSHLWALMYTESRFRRFVVSHAGARGAIQIMPVTERRLIELEQGFSARVDPDDLFDVEHNVHLAALYISELMRKFQGQAALAYASYNAGPVNVARWLEARSQISGLELDDLIEEIPYRETYRYTRRVVEVQAAYRALYDAQPATFTREVDVRIGSNINF